MASHKHQMRLATEQNYMKKHAAKLDIHDTLHSIFWGTPTRGELKLIRERLDKELVSSRVDAMQAEIAEAIEMGMGTKYREM